MPVLLRLLCCESYHYFDLLQYVIDQFDKDFKPIVQPKAVAPISGGFLEKEGLLRAALERERELASKIEGYEVTDESANIAYYSSSGSAKLLKSLTKLEQMKQLEKLAAQDVEPSAAAAAAAAGTQMDEGDAAPAASSSSTTPAAGSAKVQVLDPNNPLASATIVPTDDVTVTHDEKTKPPAQLNPEEDVLQRPLLVIIRHGKTEHNKLGLFTGWEVSQSVCTVRQSVYEM